MAELNAAREDTTLMIQVTLAKSDIDKLVKRNENAAPKLGGLATWLLADLAKGGVMLDPDVSKAISAVLKRAVWNGQEIVPLIERGTGMEGDCVIATWKIDPTYVPMLKEIAESQG